MTTMTTIIVTTSERADPEACMSARRHLSPSNASTPGAAPPFGFLSGSHGSRRVSTIYAVSLTTVVSCLEIGCFLMASNESPASNSDNSHHGRRGVCVFRLEIEADFMPESQRLVGELQPVPAYAGFCCGGIVYHYKCRLCQPDRSYSRQRAGDIPPTGQPPSDNQLSQFRYPLAELLDRGASEITRFLQQPASSAVLNSA
jgi:hypothetical protein